VTIHTATAPLTGASAPEPVTDLRLLDETGVPVTAVVRSLRAAYVSVRRIDAIDPAAVFRV
jgi:hypothetical protein